LGRKVLRQAARVAADWRDRGHPLTVAVNLSPRQFLGDGLVGDVEEACRAAGVPASSIELEITERLAMVDPQHSRRLLEHFRRLGHPVAIDDFGVGHSSLEYLLDFPISAIKVDRAFVRQVTSSSVDRAIVRAVAVIGRELALDVIAEGIETQRQCDFVEALGVNTVQGYLIARPMFADALRDWMAGFVRPTHDYSRGDIA
jgi:EAL domain-containing protein (putative c-di-GMP-specific phosphodiesterase class I)